MTTVIFRNVCDVESLFRLIDSCVGAVNLKSNHGERVELRGNGEVKELLTEACGKNGIERISLEITNEKDMPRVIDYLVSCRHKPVNEAIPNNDIRRGVGFADKIA